MLSVSLEVDKSTLPQHCEIPTLLFTKFRDKGCKVTYPPMASTITISKTWEVPTFDTGPIETLLNLFVETIPFPGTILVATDIPLLNPPNNDCYVPRKFKIGIHAHENQSTLVLEFWQADAFAEAVDNLKRVLPAFIGATHIIGCGNRGISWYQKTASRVPSPIFKKFTNIVMTAEWLLNQTFEQLRNAQLVDR